MTNHHRAKPTPLRTLLGKRLRSARATSGLSSHAVRRATGCTKQALSFWERSVHSPSLDHLVALADLYQVSLDWLTGRVGGYAPHERLEPRRRQRLGPSATSPSGEPVQ